jgi:hypothetical protein
MTNDCSQETGRDFGPIQVPSGSYFVLGDCRSSSNDSIVFGTVAGQLIEGRAAFAYWPIVQFGSSHPSESRQLMSERILELRQYTYPRMA